MSAWKSIKLPLFLGLTCLIAGGLLTAVYMVTNPIISQREQDNLSAAFKTMYSDETATVTNTITIEDENASFTEINEVTHANGQSVVYLANSTSSYERMTFYVGISRETNTVDGYYYLTTSTSSLGYGNFSNSDTVSDLYQGYDGTSEIIISGTSVTSRAVKASIDNCINDYKIRYLNQGGNSGDPSANEYYNHMYGSSAELIATANDVYDNDGSSNSKIVDVSLIYDGSQYHTVYSCQAIGDDSFTINYYLGLVSQTGAIDGFYIQDVSEYASIEYLKMSQNRFFDSIDGKVPTLAYISDDDFGSLNDTFNENLLTIAFDASNRMWEELGEQDNLSAAFKTMYSDETATVTNTITIEDENASFTEINEVTHANGQSVVYLANSTSSYERMTFYVGISRETNTVDGYYYLTTSTSSLGYGNFSNSDTVSDLYQGYDGTSEIIISGTSVTSRAVKASIDNCINDYKIRYLNQGGNSGDPSANEYYNHMYGSSAELIATANDVYDNYGSSNAFNASSRTWEELE